MNAFWGKVFGTITGGIIGGGKPKDVIEDVAVEAATDYATDKLQDAGLPVLDEGKRIMLTEALVSINMAESFYVMNDLKRIPDKLQSARKAILEVLSNAGSN